MTSKPGKVQRCAIYTRKSTEHGLELEFNSLHAQREACEAYIKSQASQGWQALARRYDDPAYSGGNLDRPALQRLLKDIDAGLIDVVVVYKIDRLTRSLADFAKLVEAFDAKAISFVAVTQQFNTTTSMGRLTLNVLLSFAQFERELSSERVRDKVAASRKKGKWMGGSVPLGYVSKDKKLIINQNEAKTVRMIFSRYLALRSFQKLVDELNQKGSVSKTREVKRKMSGGIPFTYGPLAYLLKNRTYLGETGHKGAWFPGEHEAIVDREVFEQVQQLLKANSLGRTGRRQRNGALLAGLIFDDRGNRMSPSFTVKRGVRYPFYVSSAILKGRKSDAGSVTRISALDLDAAILKALRHRVDVIDDDSHLTPQDIIAHYVSRIVVGSKNVTVTFKPSADNTPAAIEIPWSTPTKRERSRIEGANDDSARAPNPQLVQAVVRAHAWVRLLSDGTHRNVESLARSVGVHPKIVRNGVRMAFLAPDVTKAILEGDQPPSLRLKDFVGAVPLSWVEQRIAFRSDLFGTAAA
jgi:DNA invertase Pin-like site-specific DNA recombinase